MPAFADKSYYLVLLGDVYLNRYKVITKLGYGSKSTVWLSLDQKYNSFFALKIYACTSHALRESRILAELAKIRSQHIGMTAIRPVLDEFGLRSEDGNIHVCLVHPPLLVSLEGFQDLFEYTVLPTTIFRAVIYDILVVIHFLHTEAHMVHTDIQAGNIVLGSKDSSIFGKLLEAESNNPSARKTIDNYTIYQSQALTLDEIIDNIGPLFLTDFGEARTRADDWHGLIQPDPFRSSEVILKMPWTTKTDIWNIGVMDHLLLTSRDGQGNYSDAQLLAHITAILGPAPLGFVNRSPDQALYWDDKGRWIGKAEIPDDSLEKSHVRLPDEKFEQFAAFFRKMLQWDPEHRQSAAELLEDEWLLNPTE